MEIQSSFSVRKPDPWSLNVRIADWMMTYQVRHTLPLKRKFNSQSFLRHAMRETDSSDCFDRYGFSKIRWESHWEWILGIRLESSPEKKGNSTSNPLMNREGKRKRMLCLSALTCRGDLGTSGSDYESWSNCVTVIFWLKGTEFISLEDIFNQTLTAIVNELFN